MSPEPMRSFARGLLVLGSLAGLFSTWITLTFTWNKAFEATNLPHGKTHPRYHAFRGAMLALAMNLVLLWLAFSAPVAGPVLSVISFMAVFYYIGWWLPGPLFDLWTPGRGATVVHAIGTLSLIGLILLYAAS
jgi:hypothetical protein